MAKKNENGRTMKPEVLAYSYNAMKAATNALATTALLLLFESESADAIKIAGIGGVSAFFAPVEQGWNDTCSRLGIECKYVIPDFNNVGKGGRRPVDICMEEWGKLMESGYDGYALGDPSCVDDDTGQWAAMIRRVTGDGIPVVLFDREIKGSNRTSYIGTDNK
eukprot:scaffold22638_cov138-Cylindrotheca_fusiformis.AAC.1